MPPINIDSKKSMSRSNLIKRAKALFEGSGFRVAPVVVSDQSTFYDEIHAKSSDAKVQSSMRKIASRRLFENLLAYKEDSRREAV